MRTSAVVVVLVVVSLLLASCGSRGEVGQGSTYTPRDCALLGRRCSRCHTIERVEQAQLRDPRSQRDWVHRMRLMPGSGIPPEEEMTITRCLAHWAAGSTALTTLTTESSR